MASESVVILGEEVWDDLKISKVFSIYAPQNTTPYSLTLQVTQNKFACPENSSWSESKDKKKCDEEVP